MDKREQVERNLECAREFFGSLLDVPVESWPRDGASIIFVPEDDPELAEANIEAAVSNYRAGETRCYVKDVSVAAWSYEDRAAS